MLKCVGACKHIICKWAEIVLIQQKKTGKWKMHSSALWFNYKVCITFLVFRVKINDWCVIWSVSSPMEVRRVSRYNVLKYIMHILYIVWNNWSCSLCRTDWDSQWKGKLKWKNIEWTAGPIWGDYNGCFFILSFLVQPENSSRGLQAEFITELSITVIYRFAMEDVFIQGQLGKSEKQICS